MTEDKKYLKETLNQACNSTRCLYQFFIQNAIATGYLRVSSSEWINSFAVFSFPYKHIAIIHCSKSYKVRIALSDNGLIKYESYKLIGKYI